MKMTLTVLANNSASKLRFLVEDVVYLVCIFGKRVKF